MSLADMRKEYMLNGLSEGDLDPDPLVQFRAWLDAAVAGQVPEPTAMTLATVDADGHPSARMVLLKGVDSGFVFYSNYTSRKGRALAQTPYAALVFYWPQLERQVRVEGQVETMPPADSDAYFHSRPRGSQLSAVVSAQSQVIPSRADLESRLDALTAQYADQEIPLPPHWGGYRVVPSAIEFWQGRANRLHDRLRYRRQDAAGWLIERLSP